MSDELVFLTEVGDNNQASILRSYLEDHGLFCYVQGENHRSMLGMVGAYISLRLMVPRSQLEEARALLAAFHDAGDDLEEGPEMRGPFRDSGAGEEEDEEASLDEARLAQAVRRARGIALLVPIGGGHLAAGAYVRALILAAVSIGSIALAVSRGPAFLLGWPVAVVMDWFGVPDVVRLREQRAARERRDRRV